LGFFLHRVPVLHARAVWLRGSFRSSRATRFSRGLNPLPVTPLVPSLVWFTFRARVQFFAYGSLPLVAHVCAFTSVATRLFSPRAARVPFYSQFLYVWTSTVLYLHPRARFGLRATATFPRTPHLRLLLDYSYFPFLFPFVLYHWFFTTFCCSFPFSAFWFAAFYLLCRSRFVWLFLRLHLWFGLNNVVLMVLSAAT